MVLHPFFVCNQRWFFLAQTFVGTLVDWKKAVLWQILLIYKKQIPVTLSHWCWKIQTEDQSWSIAGHPAPGLV